MWGSRDSRDCWRTGLGKAGRTGRTVEPAAGDRVPVGSTSRAAGLRVFPPSPSALAPGWLCSPRPLAGALLRGPGAPAAVGGGCLSGSPRRPCGGTCGLRGGRGPCPEPVSLAEGGPRFFQCRSRSFSLTVMLWNVQVFLGDGVHGTRFCVRVSSAGTVPGRGPSSQRPSSPSAWQPRDRLPSGLFGSLGPNGTCQQPGCPKLREEPRNSASPRCNFPLAPSSVTSS